MFDVSTPLVALLAARPNKTASPPRTTATAPSRAGSTSALRGRRGAVRGRLGGTVRLAVSFRVSLSVPGGRVPGDLVAGSPVRRRLVRRRLVRGLVRDQVVRGCFGAVGWPFARRHPGRRNLRARRPVTSRSAASGPVLRRPVLRCPILGRPVVRRAARAGGTRKPDARGRLDRTAAPLRWLAGISLRAHGDVLGPVDGAVDGPAVPTGTCARPLSFRPEPVCCSAPSSRDSFVVAAPVCGFTVICSATMMLAVCWFSEVSAASRTVAVVTVLALPTACSNWA